MEKQGVKEQCGSCSELSLRFSWGSSVGPRAQLEGIFLSSKTPCAEQFGGCCYSAKGLWAEWQSGWDLVFLQGLVSIWRCKQRALL